MSSSGEVHHDVDPHGRQPSLLVGPRQTTGAGKAVA